jgi:glycerophosphoryl diester phosphodiesterase
LHDAASGLIENTGAAINAARAANYAIEVDLQISADDEAMVHHDDALGRLTEGRAALATLTAAELKRAPLRSTADRMLTLPELCDLVGGRVPLLLELKSRFDGDKRLVARTAEVMASYRGRFAAMSFDPALVLALRQEAPWMQRGIVAERWYRHPEWAALPRRQKWVMGNLLHLPQTRPHFIAYHVKDLPALVPLIARTALGLPLLTWTVRSAEDRQTAAKWASQMIFEGFRP